MSSLSKVVDTHGWTPGTVKLPGTAGNMFAFRNLCPHLRGTHRLTCKQKSLSGVAGVVQQADEAAREAGARVAHVHLVPGTNVNTMTANTGLLPHPPFSPLVDLALERMIGDQVCTVERSNR
jgi:hypothetical protein